MECVLNQFLSGFDAKLFEDFVGTNNLQQLQNHTYNNLFNLVYKAALDYLIHSPSNTVTYKIALQNSITKVPLDLRIRKVIKVASFANDLASQPNIISKDTKKKMNEHVMSKASKNMKKERLLEARKRLKEARKLWKTRPD